MAPSQYLHVGVSCHLAQLNKLVWAERYEEILQYIHILLTRIAVLVIMQ